MRGKQSAYLVRSGSGVIAPKESHHSTKFKRQVGGATQGELGELSKVNPSRQGPDLRSAAVSQTSRSNFRSAAADASRTTPLRELRIDPPASLMATGPCSE